LALRRTRGSARGAQGGPQRLRAGAGFDPGAIGGLSRAHARVHAREVMRPCGQSVGGAPMRCLVGGMAPRELKQAAAARAAARERTGR
jgi:hypothetical protein